MTSTPCNPTITSTRRQRHIILAIAVALGIVAVSCGADTGATNPEPATTSPGYSYDDDSRINESCTKMGYSYCHDSHND